MSTSSYPVKRGFYSRKELGCLAYSLGFPASLFEKVLAAPATLKTDSISESALCKLLDSKDLDTALEKTFNEYPAEYNVTLIKNACSLLRRRAMTFGEICEARVSFGLYSCEDASGMPADLPTVMQALKFLERWMSPKRLQTEIQVSSSAITF